MTDELAISYAIPETFVSLPKANDEDVLTLSIPDLMQTWVVVQIVLRVGEKTFLDGRNSCNILWAIKSLLDVAHGRTERFRFQDDDRALYFQRGPGNGWIVSTSSTGPRLPSETCVQGRVISELERQLQPASEGSSVHSDIRVQAPRNRASE